MRSNRTLIFLPIQITSGGIMTMGIMAMSVRRGLIQIMKPSARAPIVTVFTRYMIDGPATWRTACTSLVARLIRSPVRHRS